MIANIKQKLLFVLGVGTAVAVEMLTKGPWAHAVWAPVAITLFTDLEGVFDAKKAIAAIPQRVRLLLGAGGALSVELLAQGRWAHAVWAPVAIMLFTDIKEVLGLPATTPVPAVTVAPSAQPDSSESVTPIERPR